MITIDGTLITDDDARTLIDLLLRTNTHARAVAATIINQGLIDKTDVVELDDDDRAAILEVLDDDPPKGLKAVRNTLRKHAGTPWA